MSLHRSACQTYSICNSSWSPLCRHAKLSETEWEVSRDGERGWDNMESQLLCPCLVLISLERQRWPCWVKASTSRATGLDSWPWSGRWEVTREVGVGSAYAGLQRAGERGNISVCLCYSEIGKECLSGVVYQSVCVLVRVCMTLQTPLWQGLYYISEEFSYEGSVIWLTLHITPVEITGPLHSDSQIGRHMGQGSRIYFNNRTFNNYSKWAFVFGSDVYLSTC